MDELVWKNSTKVSRWPDYVDRLAKFGLTPEQVSPIHLVKAQERYRARIAANLKGDYLRWKAPYESHNGVSGQHIWETEDGQYKAARIAGPTPRFAAVVRTWDAVAEMRWGRA